MVTASHGIYKLLLTLVTTLLLISCSDDPKKVIRIASSPWPGYEPLYLARDLGYLSPDIYRVFELPSSDITMESFRNRSSDVATLTLDETLELLQENTPLRIVLILDISNGGDAVMAGPDVTELSDIKGKRISAVNIPLGLYMLSRLLDKANVARSEIELSLMPETHQLNHYKQGKSDVVITYDPVKTQLENEGMHVLFDSSEIPNEIFDLLVVHEDTYLEYQDEICALVNQWYRTLAYMNENHRDASLKISRRLGVNAAEYEGMMKGILLPDKAENKVMLGGKSPGLLKSAERLEQIMLEQGLLHGPVDTSKAIDAEFVNCQS